MDTQTTSNDDPSIQEARDRVARAKLALLEVPQGSNDLMKLTESISRHPYKIALLGLAAGLALSSGTVMRGLVKLLPLAAGKVAGRAILQRLLMDERC